jgi:hypothetical protein
MRLPPILLTLALLAACEESPPTPPAATDLRAGFPKGGAADTIRIDAVDPLPIHAAELIAPDGTATPAKEIVATPQPHTTGLSGANDPFHSVLSGPGSFASAVVPSSPTYSGAPVSETHLLATVSIASILLPDPVAYRHDWQHYRLRVEFGTADSTPDIRELAAPEPPPHG